MTGSLKQAMAFLAVLILLTCSSWYFASGLSVGKLDDIALSKMPDMFMQTVRVDKFDDKGILANQLTSPSMIHYPQDDNYFFESPLITARQIGQPDWFLRSEKGRAIHRGETLIFTHKVVMHQESGPTTQESQLTTEKIVYFPKEKKAISDALVTFKQPGVTLQSMGLTAYLADKRVLLNKARGSYVPKVS